MLVAAAALLLASALPQAHAAGAREIAATEIVTTRRDGHDRLTVPVRIGAGGTYRFLLDTGAQNTVVSNTLADRLALPARDDVLLLGVAGSRQVRSVLLHDLALGRRRFGGLIAPVLQAHDIGADGIIGLDSLQGQRVVIDFRRNLITIDDAAGASRDTGFDVVVRARRRSGQLIITDARIDGIRVAVIVDTGADASIANRALQRVLGKRATLSRTLLTSVTGQVAAADVGYVSELNLQGLAISNVLLAFSDAPPFAHLGLDRRPAILLGMREMRLFDRVAIDFASRRILFDVER
ncbi:MAG: retroviral-like aspartic protease family protein [Pseudomonadota bacterium]